MADVFISYARADRALAEALAARMRAAGYTVWWDAALVAGTGFGLAIQAEVDAARVMFVIWTETSAKSQWVYAEASYAARQNKLAPLAANGFDPANAPPPFNTAHCRIEEDLVAAALDELARRGVGPSGTVSGGIGGGPSHDPSLPTVVVDPWPGRGDHRTIAEAIAAAPEGARVLIRPGHYEENVVLTKALELIGDGPREEVVISVAKGIGMHLKTPLARVAGLTVERLKSEEKNTAVWITSGRPVIENCVFTCQSLAALDVKGQGTAPRLRGCVMRDSAQAGAFFRESARGELVDCLLTNNGFSGFQATGEAAPTLRGCRMVENRQSGAYIYERGAGEFHDCAFDGNGRSGVQIEAEADPALRGCTLSGNAQIGAFVFSNGRGQLIDCTMKNNGYDGVAMKTGGAPTVRGCVLENNRWGVRDEDGAGGGVFENNTLRGNKRGAWSLPERKEDAGPAPERRGNTEE